MNEGRGAHTRHYHARFFAFCAFAVTGKTNMYHGTEMVPVLDLRPVHAQMKGSSRRKLARSRDVESMTGIDSSESFGTEYLSQPN